MCQAETSDKGRIRYFTTTRAVCVLVSLLLAIYIGYTARFRGSWGKGSSLHHPDLWLHDRDFLSMQALGTIMRQGVQNVRNGTDGSLCIIMSDNRPLVPLQPGTKITEIPYYQMTVYYNLLYALRHGYCFRRVHAERDEGYNWTWPKIQVMLQQLNDSKHDVFVYMDGDSYVTDPAVPFSHMFDVAGFKASHSLMMARDPDVEVNRNIHGSLNLNTGFMVAKNNAVARRIYSDILTCPDRLEECEHFKLDWPHEQGAFSDYVMPYVASQDLLQAECDLFNGYQTEPHCTGQFVSHAWGAQKGLLTEILQHEVLSACVQALESVLLPHHSMNDS